jgi:hypothetical protein
VRALGNEEKQKRNELVRRILQLCGACSHGQGKGRGLICDRKKSQCHSKRVRKWLEEIDFLEVKQHEDKRKGKSKGRDKDS